MVQKERTLEKKEGLIHGVLERRVGGVIGTCSKKPQSFF
jgi:hypothetical protein